MLPISLPSENSRNDRSYTGAVKIFSAQFGTYKAELHFRLNERKSFCSMLVDLHEDVIETDIVHYGRCLGIMETTVRRSQERRHIGLVTWHPENAHALVTWRHVI